MNEIKPLQYCWRNLVALGKAVLLPCPCLLLLGLSTAMRPAAAELHADFNGDGYDDLAIAAPDYDLRRNAGDDAAPRAGQVTVLFGTSGGLFAVRSQRLNLERGWSDRALARDAFGAALAAGDFDCDGWDDLAVSAPLRDLDFLRRDSGAVYVYYGGPLGLQRRYGATGWNLDRDGLPTDTGSGNSRFGSALASGDFDNDGCAELAIGAPHHDEENAPAASGAVFVLPGSPTGLTAEGSIQWTQDSTGIRDVAESGDFFGSSLAVGDFDADGTDDLAISSPGESLHDDDPRYIWRAGIVHILFGSPSGLTAIDNQRWHQNVPGIEGRADAEDEFGTAIAAGDLNGDGVDDLVVGSPFETLLDNAPRPHYRAGTVNILYGSSSGLTTAGNLKLHQDTAGMPDQAAEGDFFGISATIADLDGDGYDDLAIGADREDLRDAEPDRVSSAGIVHAIFGGPEGPQLEGSEVWHEDSPGIPDRADSGELFGAALSHGDYNGDGFSDLAIGIDHEGLGPVLGAGAVLVLPGFPGGLSAPRARRFTQGSDHIDGGVQEQEHFGQTLR